MYIGYTINVLKNRQAAKAIKNDAKNTKKRLSKDKDYILDDPTEIQHVNISCSVDGYTFVGWKDKTGKMYQPQETLSVTYTGEVIYYTIYAEWEKNSLSLDQTPKSTAKVVSENKETSDFSKISFLAIAVAITAIAIAIIMIKIHFHKKHKKNL